jgi:hypothetical protein
MKKTTASKPVANKLTPIGRALRRAALSARQTARMHATPIYLWRNGKVVAEEP